MRKIVKIRPSKKGLIIRMPNAIDEILPEEGRRVEYNNYWANRVKDGDAEIVTDEQKKPKKQSQGSTRKRSETV